MPTWTLLFEVHEAADRLYQSEAGTNPETSEMGGTSNTKKYRRTSGIRSWVTKSTQIVLK